MSWHVYKVRYQVLSPLHIGHRKIGNIQCTRYYIPGRTMWGAITAKITRSVRQSPRAADYREIGEYVKNHIITSYFFFALENKSPFFPKFSLGKMNFQELPVEQFEANFVSSRSTTAINFSNFAAEEGTLHEIELIMPKAMADNSGKNVFLEGFIYIDQDRSQTPVNLILSDNEILDILKQLKVGADHGYGNGKISLVNMDAHPKLLNSLSPIDFNTTSNTIMAHLKYTEKLNSKIDGPVEPLVGREWGNGPRSGPGQDISQAEICWTPGAKIIGDISSFKIGLKTFGIWEVEDATNP